MMYSHSYGLISRLKLFRICIRIGFYSLYTVNFIFFQIGVKYFFCDLNLPFINISGIPKNTLFYIFFDIFNFVAFIG